MTEKLYLSDPYLREWDATVVHSAGHDNGAAVELDRSAFYPAGGGQLHDTGEIDGIRVTDVFERDGCVFHVLDEHIPGNKTVHCAIDFDRRFDHMQQHTGQHILSQSIVNTLNAPTISSSLGSESSTIDIDRPSFSEKDARTAEREANEWIYRNVPVHILYPEPEELAAMPLRKAPPGDKKPRIVHIEGLDYSPCGGTHCSRTGEVGVISIRRWEKMRGNIRLEFVCGRRALKDYQKKSSIASRLSTALTTGEDDLISAVERLQSDLKIEQKARQELRGDLFRFQAQDMFDRGIRLDGVTVINTVLDSGSMQELQQLGRDIRALGSSIVLLGTGSERPQFVFTRSDDVNIDLNKLLTDLKPDFDLKGGGSPGMVQGALNAPGGIESLLASAEERTAALLKR